MFCIVALIGLSIYIIVDYKKYQDLLGKIGKRRGLSLFLFGLNTSDSRSFKTDLV